MFRQSQRVYIPNVSREQEILALSFSPEMRVAIQIQSWKSALFLLIQTISTDSQKSYTEQPKWKRICSFVTHLFQLCSLPAEATFFLHSFSRKPTYPSISDILPLILAGPSLSSLVLTFSLKSYRWLLDPIVIFINIIFLFTLG